jgi:hypothetical protein
MSPRLACRLCCLLLLFIAPYTVLFSLQGEESEVPAALANASQAWIKVAGANIREGSGTDYPRLRVLPANTPVEIQNRRDEWCEITFSVGEDDLRGWVYAPLLSDRSLSDTELNSLQDLGRSSNALDNSSVRVFLAGLLVILISWIAYKLHRGWRAAGLEKGVTQKATEIVKLIQGSFQVEPCPRCHEFENQFMDVSPNARSVQLKCTTCGRKYWARAISPDGYQLSSQYSDLLELESRLGALRNLVVETRISFEVPKGPMPFEQTTREPIRESVRAEVWRRDGGACAQCESRENLQFDHIIPVSKGGATTTANLQLLCRTCNLRKASAI